jgi:hypothetical protein
VKKIGLPLFSWESMTKHGTRRLVIGPSFVLLILGVVGLVTNRIEIGAWLGAGAGAAEVVRSLLRGRA